MNFIGPQTICKVLQVIAQDVYKMLSYNRSVEMLEWWK